MISFSQKIRCLLTKIVDSDEWHAKWLNTLSFMENCGARKIAACEHPTLVKEEMLKHAAEEFRHAHYLKQQIKKVTEKPHDAYSALQMIGGVKTLHYLTLLDVKTSQYLKQLSFSKSMIKEAAYLLVTYSIELRAKELYQIYDDVLRQARSRVTVKSILLEEQEHLTEMKEGIEKLFSGYEYAAKICDIESRLCLLWLDAIEHEYNIYKMV